MRRTEPAWRPWALAAGAMVLAGLLLSMGVRALEDPWPRIVETGLFVLLVLLLGLLVIDAVFGAPFGLNRWLFRALHRFTARFSSDRGGLWFSWAASTKDPGWCLDCLVRSASLGHSEGMREFGRYYLDGGMGTTARAAGLPWLRRAAQARDAEAAYFLGEMLRWGLGSAPKPAEALGWYLQSAQAGYRPAARWLAQAFLGGDGLEAAPEKAAQWTRAADGMAGADQPEPSVLTRLGHLEESGGATATEIMDEAGEALWSMKGFRILVAVLCVLVLGVAALVVFAVPMLRFLLLTLLLSSLVVIVIMRLMGHHAPRASREGSRLEARAALDPEASFQLGLRFERGHSDAPRDLELARRHFARAVEAGHAGAALHLADLLSWGMGGPKDVPRARTLLERLARTGHPEAAARLQRLEPGLSPGASSADQPEEGKSR